MEGKASSREGPFPGRGGGPFPGRAAPVGPPPGLATPSHPGESQGLRGRGLFTRFICFSGKVRNIRALSHIKAEGRSRGRSQLKDSRRRGPTATAQGHLRDAPPPPPRGRAESGSRLQPEVGPAPALGTRPEAPGAGRDGASRATAHRCGSVSVRTDVPLGASVAASGGNPSPLLARGGQAHVGRGSAGDSAEEAPCPGLRAPAAARNVPSPVELAVA